MVLPRDGYYYHLLTQNSLPLLLSTLFPTPLFTLALKKLSIRTMHRAACERKLTCHLPYGNGVSVVSNLRHDAL